MKKGNVLAVGVIATMFAGFVLVAFGNMFGYALVIPAVIFAAK